MRNHRKYILLILDAIIVVASYLSAVTLKSEFEIPKASITYFASYIPYVVLIYIASFAFFKLYSIMWTYAGINEYLDVLYANMISFIGCILLDQFIKSDITISTIIIGGLFSFILTEGIRIIYRLMTNMDDSSILSDANMTRILIIGAGKAGKLLLNEIKHNRKMNYRVVGFIDDDLAKVGQIIGGVKVLGTSSDVSKIVEERSIDEVIFSIPSLNNADKSRILSLISETNVKIKILPNIPEALKNPISVNSIRNVEITELLGRKEIELDKNEVRDYLENKTIMVTGGGGSIGSELCRQISEFKPKKLIIFDIYENNAYDIEQELKLKHPELNLLVLIGSVRDYDKIDEVIKEQRPDMIFHAAAHKHVPLMETSPAEAVKNNVFGTYNLAKAANKYGVKRFLLISTDKAVNPTNIMGATKRLCEMIIQTFNSYSKTTDFVAVRFGNVLGSNGSVIPLFKRQIANGGPVTVTHKEITRYFMTIPEAVQLVLTAGSFAKGGEIFVLDMGKPVKIYDLAVNLIKLSGYTLGKDMNIEITGLRPGEKLYEELLMAEEGLQKTKNSLIYIGKPNDFDMDKLILKLERLKEIVSNPEVSNYVVKTEMKKIVDTYNYNPDLDLSKEENK